MLMIKEKRAGGSSGQSMVFEYCWGKTEGRKAKMVMTKVLKRLMPGRNRHW